MAAVVRPPIAVRRAALDSDEIGAIADALRTSQDSGDRLVEELERTFATAIGTRFAVAVSSETTALHLSLVANGVRPYDEVITTAYAPPPSVHAIRLAGARPIFVDIRDDTFTLDSSLIEERITERTRAILPVHLYGAPADMHEILDVARRYDLRVIENAAHAQYAAIGGRLVGSFGTGCFTFDGDMPSSVVRGGIITTDSPVLDERLRLLRADGVRGGDDPEFYGHDCGVSEIQAAVGLVQTRSVRTRAESRIEHAAYLAARLPSVGTPVTLPEYRHVFHEFTIRVPHGRDVVARRLVEAGVGTSTLTSQPLHRDAKVPDRRRLVPLPVSDRASRELLSLPVHAALTHEDLDLVAERVASVVARLAPQQFLRFTF